MAEGWERKASTVKQRFSQVLADLGIDVFRVSTPHPALTVNTYFVQEPVPTLVDAPTGSRDFLGELETCIKALGYALEDIETVIVTHPHPDHWGSARAIADRMQSESLGSMERAPMP